MIHLMFQRLILGALVIFKGAANAFISTQSPSILCGKGSVRTLGRSKISSLILNNSLQIEQSMSKKEEERRRTVPNIVLVAGFESFNKQLYEKSVQNLEDVNIQVFADDEIRISPSETNPRFIEAMKNADLFIGSLLFDYDDVMAVENLLHHVKGPRLIFECATELMAYNKVGSFNMKTSPDVESSGPPPVVKAVLSLFTSSREEDRVAGYVKLLKIGPDLLKFVPGEKASDLKTWLEAYRYWNQEVRQM